jgi:hypothetical protein
VSTKGTSASTMETTVSKVGNADWAAGLISKMTGSSTGTDLVCTVGTVASTLGSYTSRL